jgi:hypothetical protein
MAPGQCKHTAHDRAKIVKQAAVGPEALVRPVGPDGCGPVRTPARKVWDSNPW